MTGLSELFFRAIVLLHACQLLFAFQMVGLKQAWHSDGFVPGGWGNSAALQTRPALRISEDGGAVDGLTEQETLSRMSYWTVRDQALPPTDKYTLFTADTGGPNNIRIGWEMTGLVAQATGRTLVLPPASRMYLLDSPTFLMPRWPVDVPQESTTTAVEDLINLDQLKGYLPTLTWEEFANRTGLTWEAAVAESKAVDLVDTCSMPAYKTVTERILYMTGDGPRREGFLCGEWWLSGGPIESLRADITEDGWSLLTHGFVWHEDAYAIASKAVNFLGMFEYSALHARYGDFQFTEGQADPTEIMDSMKGFLKLGTKLYVASDDPVSIRSLTGMKDFDIVTFDDLLAGVLKDVPALYTSERWFKLLGLVEELICTYAKIFVGTSHSSFSGHIHRMRLHAQAPVTRTLMYGEDLDGVYDHATAADAQADIAAWELSGKVHTVDRASPSKGDQFLQHTGDW